MISKVSLYICCYDESVFNDIKKNLVCFECLVRSRCLHIREIIEELDRYDNHVSVKITGRFHMVNACEKMIHRVNEIPPDIRRTCMSINVNGYAVPWSQLMRIENDVLCFNLEKEKEVNI